MNSAGFHYENGVWRIDPKIKKEDSPFLYTLYNWRDTDSYFRELLPIVGSSYEYDDAEGSLRQLIRRGDGPSIRYFLRKHHPTYKVFRPKRAGTPKGYSRDEQGRFTKDLPKNKVKRSV